MWFMRFPYFRVLPIKVLADFINSMNIVVALDIQTISPGTTE